DRGTVRGAQPSSRRVDQLTEPLSLEQRRGTCARAGRRTGEGCSLAPTGHELASLSHQGGQLRMVSPELCNDLRRALGRPLPSPVSALPERYLEHTRSTN